MRLKRSVKVGTGTRYGTESHQYVDVPNKPRVATLPYFYPDLKETSISITSPICFHCDRTENGSDNCASEEHLKKSEPRSSRYRLLFKPKITIFCRNI
jgi:hypothetical protein